MRFSEFRSPVCCCTLVAAVIAINGCSNATNTPEVPAVTAAIADPVGTEVDEVVADSGESESVPSEIEVSAKQTATFAAGCFWCVEAVFEQLKSVENVRSGYAGGAAESASYKLVSGGGTRHAEVIQFDFDPTAITYEELLEVFWLSHDPTTLNRQGFDVGTQYRSAVFYHNDEQRSLAEAYKKRLTDENAFGNPVVTEIAPFESFYTAEAYHQDYYTGNSAEPYCQRIIRPKVEKVRKVFASKLRD